jgi:hypothetical protein
MIGSTVRKNDFQSDIAAQEQFKTITGGDDLTEEDRFLLLKAFEEQKEAKKKKSFLNYTDNPIGPGHYEPNRDYTMRGSPSARITAATAQELGTGNNITSGGLANLISSDGNIAERVNAAQGQIQKYLGLVNKKKNLIAGNLGSQGSLHIGSDGKH